MGIRKITPQASVDLVLGCMGEFLDNLYEGRLGDLNEEEQEAADDADRALKAFDKYIPLFKTAPKLLQTCKEMKRFVKAEQKVFPGDSGLEALMSDLDSTINEATGKALLREICHKAPASQRGNNPKFCDPCVADIPF